MPAEDRSGGCYTAGDVDCFTWLDVHELFSLQLGSNSQTKMTESAEAVAADVASKRSVTIEISNVTNNYCLINPR